MASSSSTPVVPNAAVVNPCHQVRRTCHMLMEDPDSPVSIDNDAMERLVVQDMPSSNYSAEAIEWDKEGWHYRAEEIHDPAERKERIALYILALDSINFCFWPHPILETNTLEYNHLAVALTNLARQDQDDEYFFAPSRLATITPNQMEAALQPHLHRHYLPNIKERCRLWNELGVVLLMDFGGLATNLINSCQQSAPRLVRLLTCHFSGFRDESLHHHVGTWLAFYKRAQIAVADLNAATLLQLEGMEDLTTFADYRVPQLLRHVGILQYRPELANKVDNRIELVRDEEVYIRAGTVVAVDRLVELYNKNKVHVHANQSEAKMTAVQMDWYLWQVGERLNEEHKMKPFHRVNTIFY